MELTDLQRSLLEYCLKSSEVDADVQRRVDLAISQGLSEDYYVLDKLAACYERMCNEWLHKLEGVQLPESQLLVVEQIISQVGYKDRDARDLAELPPQRVPPLWGRLEAIVKAYWSDQADLGVIATQEQVKGILGLLSSLKQACDFESQFMIEGLINSASIEGLDLTDIKAALLAELVV